MPCHLLCPLAEFSSAAWFFNHCLFFQVLICPCVSGRCAQRWGTACDANQQILPGGTYAPPGIDWARDFHTFSVDWSADSMDFAVDGHVYETKTSSEVFLTDAIFRQG